jgi:adenine/guanine phosphoribosyltransferase-like PRPP-binding protein
MDNGDARDRWSASNADAVRHGADREQPRPAIPQLFVMPIVNRARAQLASALDGRYGSMLASDVRSAIRWLVDQADLEGVGHVLGIPEGGSIPAYSFADATGLRLVLATIWQPDCAGVVSFAESHDPPPVTGKHVYGLSAGDHAIIVEDEVTSGQTVVNCVLALRRAGIRCGQVATIYAANDPSMQAMLAANGIRLHAAAWFDAGIGDRLYPR